MSTILIYEALDVLISNAPFIFPKRFLFYIFSCVTVFQKFVGRGNFVTNVTKEKKYYQLFRNFALPMHINIMAILLINKICY